MERVCSVANEQTGAHTSYTDTTPVVSYMTLPWIERVLIGVVQALFEEPSSIGTSCPICPFSQFVRPMSYITILFFSS